MSASQILFGRPATKSLPSRSGAGAARGSRRVVVRLLPLISYPLYSLEALRPSLTSPLAFCRSRSRANGARHALSDIRRLRGSCSVDLAAPLDEDSVLSPPLRGRSAPPGVIAALGDS